MEDIKALNKEIDTNNEEVESMITELVEREEYACTGNACAGKGCVVN